MDMVDEEILALLSADGKLTRMKLADRVGLSLSACQRRVKALESSGMISGYRAVVNPALLGEGFSVFAFIQLRSHARSDALAFADAVKRLHPVKEVHHIAGEYDYLIKVSVETLTAYETFHTDRLAAIPGVSRIVTHIPMSTLKE